MRVLFAVSAAALAIAVTAPAQAQMYMTSIIASVPDPNGKVPAFNVVPGAGVTTWSNSLAQAVLTHGQTYEYCVSLASATVSGTAGVYFSINRGSTVIQSKTIIKPADFTVGSNGVWNFCAGFMTLPNSPGAATLKGEVAYYPTGSTVPTRTFISAPVLLQ